MSELKPTIYPTLVIGLGGSGTNVVRYVKRRFLKTWRADDQGDLTDLPAALQVLAVDTEPLVNPSDEEPLYSHEFAFLGKFDATRLVQNRRNHAPYLDWWQRDPNDLPLGYIHNGATPTAADRPPGVFPKLRDLQDAYGRQAACHEAIGLDPGG